MSKGELTLFLNNVKVKKYRCYFTFDGKFCSVETSLRCNKEARIEIARSRGASGCTKETLLKHFYALKKAHRIEILDWQPILN